MAEGAAVTNGLEVLQGAADLFQNGGIVMVPLLVCSLVLWTMVFLRAELMLSLRGGADRLPALLPSGKGSALARYLDGSSEVSEDETSLLRRVEVDLLRVRQVISRHRSFVRSLIRAVPLLGLLGTVSGMIHTFHYLGQRGAGDGALSEGISEALLSTQAGLMIAAPALIIARLVDAREEMALSEVSRIEALLGHAFDGEHGRVSL